MFCSKNYIENSLFVEENESVNSASDKLQLQNLNTPPTSILIAGPNGIGKSCLAYTLAKELGYNIIEINASQCRSGKALLTLFGEALQSHRISVNDSISNEVIANYLSNVIEIDDPSYALCNNFLSFALSKRSVLSTIALCPSPIRPTKRKVSTTFDDFMDELVSDTDSTKIKRRLKKIDDTVDYKNQITNFFNLSSESKLAPSTYTSTAPQSTTAPKTLKSKVFSNKKSPKKPISSFFPKLSLNIICDTSSVDANTTVNLIDINDNSVVSITSSPILGPSCGDFVVYESNHTENLTAVKESELIFIEEIKLSENGDVKENKKNCSKSNLNYKTLVLIDEVHFFYILSLI